jgi:hypothetical protein
MSVSKNIRATWKIKVDARLANILHIYENGTFKAPLENVIRRSLRGLDELVIEMVTNLE